MKKNVWNLTKISENWTKLEIWQTVGNLLTYRNWPNLSKFNPNLFNVNNFKNIAKIEVIWSKVIKNPVWRYWKPSLLLSAMSIVVALSAQGADKVEAHAATWTRTEVPDETNEGSKFFVYQMASPDWSRHSWEVSPLSQPSQTSLLFLLQSRVEHSAHR